MRRSYDGNSFTVVLYFSRRGEDREKVSPSTSSRLIYWADLVNRHTLSFTDQPFLWDLVKDIRGKKPLTLIVGAGVSMQSGLPSWGTLVSRLIDAINDDDLEYFVKNADIDLLRRAGVAVALLERHDPVDMKLLVRNALFPTNSLVGPGQLAQAIARLAVSRETEVRIVTTNYDTFLEQAIATYMDKKVESFSLDEKGEWIKCNGLRTPAVLHVHGLVSQEGVAKGPIVLTESEFLNNGAAVRHVIAESLRDSMALLIGLSLTDPNLVGPLYETKDAMRRGSRYSLNVVGPVVSETEDREKAAKYHVEAARYLLKLDLNPILLKSYSQLNQAVSDLGLAIREPLRYAKRPPKGQSSLLYGKRFTRALTDLYAELGCDKEPFVPTGDVSKRITCKLRAALKGPEKFLTSKIREHAPKHTQPEHFQLCLWLRRQDRVTNKPSYSLELLGSSTFHNYEAWALRRDVKITGNSPYAAAQAVYQGLSVCTNLDPNKNAGIWKGVLAIPINLGSTSSDAVLNGIPMDQLTVGSLTLDSTLCVTNAHSDGSVVPDDELGIIGRLHKRDVDELIDRLYDAVPVVLFGD
jgi:SIR2-like domain